MARSTFPSHRTSAGRVLEELREAKSGDVDWRAGRTSLYVQFGGDDVLDLAKQAAQIYFSENAHGVAAFPSVVRMQAEVLEWLLDLVGAGPLADGCFTASGSESILMSLKAARDWARRRRPDIGSLKIVCRARLIRPSTRPPIFLGSRWHGRRLVRTTGPISKPWRR
jgi:glutamate/tyrosine decarboxylase-like PLP-dependent enzyme